MGLLVILILETVGHFKRSTYLHITCLSFFPPCKYHDLYAISSFIAYKSLKFFVFLYHFFFGVKYRKVIPCSVSLGYTMGDLAF